ncbi:transglutaminase-like domain-containing protein [Sphingobacterium spiritivorum]|uniref:transglutaminase-like domain-containing protein n=1 Tax=Sphingobacterium TaxID=28453 RepID=UPI001602E7E4|nr:MULTISPECIES: transglutaminase family protein [Sphingobacterium]MBB1646419.1 hypothetical protein [Sphingobacterium sp. UME9]
MKKYLKETQILDYNHPSIQRIVNQRYWKDFDTIFRIKAIYNYVRDEIKFAYESHSTSSSSQVILNGYGDNNTKSILLMSFLRAVGVPTRVHGFIVSKSLIASVPKDIWYKVLPNKFRHSLVEIYVESDWYILEGIMLDKDYLDGLTKVYNEPECENLFLGLKASQEDIDFENLKVNPLLKKSIIKQEYILEDLGVFESPDKFYFRYPKQSNTIKIFFFKNLVRHLLNKQIDKIRKR